MWHFDAQTLQLLVTFVSPDASEAMRIARAAAHDDTLLATILQDRRLHARLFDTPHELIVVAPHAFFAAMLYRVRADLKTQTFTHERNSGRTLVIFDVDRVRALLAADAVIAYLSWVLASFVRITSITRRVRVRSSVWRTHTVSDFDLDSLLGYVRGLEVSRRPVIYRRIGEVALFQGGVFPEAFAVRERRSRHADSLTDLAAIGTDALQRALDGGAVIPEEADAVRSVRDGFGEATKAFTFMSDHYLGALRTKFFAASAGA